MTHAESTIPHRPSHLINLAPRLALGEYYIPPPPTKMGDIVGGGSSGILKFMPLDRVRKAVRYQDAAQSS